MLRACSRSRRDCASIRAGHPIAGQGAWRAPAPRLALDGGDHFFQRVGQVSRAALLERLLQQPLRLLNLAHGQKQSGPEDPFGFRRRFPALGVLRQRLDQIPAAVGRQRGGQRLSGLGAQFQFIRVQDGRVIQRPLNDIDSVDERELLRRLILFHHRPFAGPDLDRAVGIAQFHLAVQQRQFRPPIGVNSQVELRSSNGSRGRGRLELRLIGLVTVEKVCRTGFDLNGRALLRLGRRPDGHGRQFIHPHHAQIGQPHGGPAPFAGADLIAHAQSLTGAAGGPIGHPGGRHINRA